MTYKNDYLSMDKKQVKRAIEMYMEKQLDYIVPVVCTDIKQRNNEIFEVRFKPFSEGKNDGNRKKIISLPRL